MRLPTFTRSAGTTTEDRAASSSTASGDETTREIRPRPQVDERTTPYNRTSADKTDVVERPTPPPARPAEPVPAPTGPRPRTSIMATVGLALGVAAAALVLTGLLAGYGVAVAAIALLASLGGFAATRRRHVAGKLDALIGMIVSAAALVFGILALTGDLSWLGTDVDTVGRAREWLDAQFVDRF